MAYGRNVFREEHSLPLLNVLLVLLCIAYVPLSTGPVLADLPEIAIPIAVTVVLVGYSLRLLQRAHDVAHVKQVSMYGWTGATVTAFGAWWFLQHLQRQLSTTVLFDEALTAISIGTGLGVFLGAHAIHEYSIDHSEHTTPHVPERHRLLAETTWTNEPKPGPILSAVTEQLSEIEGVDPLDVPPLYEHVNPSVFTELRASDDSQWQLRFYTDEYEVRVSSGGTVTIYEAEHAAGGHETAVSDGPER